jgi:hypothetical protein
MTAPHADVTAPTDRVRCAPLSCELAASECAARHVARDHGGHRHQRDRGAFARYRVCALCPDGATALVRLGLRGTPGRVVAIRLGDVAGEP